MLRDYPVSVEPMFAEIMYAPGQLGEAVRKNLMKQHPEIRSVVSIEKDLTSPMETSFGRFTATCEVDAVFDPKRMW